MSLTANAISSDGELAAIGGLYGSIDQVRIEGFERSILTLIASGGPVEWWISAKNAFSSDFVEYADMRLATDSFNMPLHSGMKKEYAVNEI